MIGLTSNPPFGPSGDNLQRLPGVSMEEALKSYGVTRLHPFQAEAISASCFGRNVLVVQRTGYGKSFCYIGAALRSGQLTVVVSPLIALMNDQVQGLNSRGISCATIHSAQTKKEQFYLESL